MSQVPGTSIPNRSEVPEHETWDLTPIFADDAAQAAAQTAIEAELPALAAYAGRLGESAATLADALILRDDLERRLSLVYLYAHLRHDEDSQNQTYVALEARARALVTRYRTATSWLAPELAMLDPALLTRFQAEDERLMTYRHALEDIARRRPHVLGLPEEKLLARTGEVLDSSRTIFSTLNNADLVFPKIRDEAGQEVELSHARYGRFLESRDPRVRRDAFTGLYSVYRQFRNTFAATLSATVKQHNALAETRGFTSARARALFEAPIPETVYDKLVATVNSRLDLLHDYVALRRRLMGLEEVHSYDLYVPIVPSVDVRYSYTEACDLLRRALAPLGPDYLALLERAFSERWIDYADNRGKRSGAYSSGTYGTPPYILMNWQGTLDNVYTLAHELGHSMHSWYTHQTQPYVYSDYSIFLAEIASTTNENLLTHYLLQTTDDTQVRAYVINQYLDGVKGTVFRQTQFAEFEQLIHQADREGTALTAAWLSEQYAELNRRYYGPALSFDEEIALEWARIPHFYFNFYVYQYATGFSAATAFADRILCEGGPAVRRYLGFLQAGSSAWPLDVLREAGLDMTSPAPITATLDRFADYLAQFGDLLADTATKGGSR
ncbi:MAG: oligoendopeptidase F [Bacillota bacterium]|nr:oligoendopeptidase F [Bacillota bacterium]